MANLNIFNINGYESPGRRFNGISITELLSRYGINASHFVWEKDTNDDMILTCEGKYVRRVNEFIRRVEDRLSLQSVLYPNARKIMKMPAFENADVLHLHIIHSGYLSFGDLPVLTNAKPTVWTLHDPWAMTGHCVYPISCNRWLNECGQCPDLNAHFPLRFDTTNFLFHYKRKAYKKSNFDLIVASSWMEDMVSRSPMFEHARVHKIPFGIDLDFFSDKAAPDARARFGIPDDALVICFRAVNNSFKGLPFILEALRRIKSSKRICLLTFNTAGLLEEFRNTFQIVELGWTNDEQLTRDAFVASDIFLMPSTAEAFGVMAIEALACSKPLIVFEGTALPEVVFSPDVGIAVPMRDAVSLFDSLQRLIENSEERAFRGKLGRKVAEKYYGQDLFAARLSEVYKMVAQS
ncbi:glycosyltransferase [Polynucleobacter necessarius]|uniref:glycosyltransferase n=1 Tax=Polynucleobacter necessarius TaxID=576610 RepID=UPI000E095F79|nr:glycosyltransferase [Polynucleobacter necessarius]